MKFYSFDEIRAAGDCQAYAAEVYGAKVKAGRCNAAWRNGTNPTSVSIDREKYYDHSDESGGGIIELAAIQFGGDKQQAQEHLGERYNLTPKYVTGPAPQTPGASQYDRLIAEGYTEAARYYYNDARGNLAHFVVRMEHPTEPKQFCQGNPFGWGVKGVNLVLYNLQAISASPWCAVVEGEKDADLLISHGIPATTCCGGSKKWQESYTETLRGKSVAILPDNDEAGRKHADMVAESLLKAGCQVRIVPTSAAPKGDVYDYIVNEGHTIADVHALIKAAKPITEVIKTAIVVPRAPDAATLKAAKEANAIPLRNYIPVKVTPDPKSRRKQSEIERKPRIIQDIIDDFHRRFIGFPRKVGEQLFDHDRDSDRIVEINRPSELFAWAGRKSKNCVDWARGDAFPTKDEILAGLRADAIRYESISHVPDWPLRNDVYYAHSVLPAACPARSRFERLLSEFAPATPEDKTFLRALFAAPLWYRRGIPKPSWVIDSEDGAGTGKSTIAEAVATLYDGEPIRTNRQELRMGIQELIKRLISSTGRGQRVVMIDNVIGQFSCPELADLITAQSVSGRAPYGHGEETRPNNLVFIITANTATVDNDIADRSYYINVCRPPRDPSWRNRVMDYIDANRMEIIADIIATLENKVVKMQAQTRFPEFETQILQAMCASESEATDALAHLKACKADTNVEDEQAQAITDILREKICELEFRPDDDTLFIRTPVIEFWLADAVDRKTFTGGLAQHVRNLAKMGLIPMIDAKVKRFPHRGNDRRSGFMWNNRRGIEPRVIVMDGKNKARVTL